MTSLYFKYKLNCKISSIIVRIKVNKKNKDKSEKKIYKRSTMS